MRRILCTQPQSALAAIWTHLSTHTHHSVRVRQLVRRPKPLLALKARKSITYVWSVLAPHEGQIEQVTLETAYVTPSQLSDSEEWPKIH